MKSNQSYSLDDLLDSVSEDNRHDEILSSEPQGKELKECTFELEDTINKIQALIL